MEGEEEEEEEEEEAAVEEKRCGWLLSVKKKKKKKKKLHYSTAIDGTDPHNLSLVSKCCQFSTAALLTGLNEVLCILQQQCKWILSGTLCFFAMKNYFFFSFLEPYRMGSKDLMACLWLN